MTKLIHKYLRHDKKMPHMWCPGCGNGLVLGSLVRAIHKMKLAKDEVVIVSGIGCSGRMPVYLDFNTLHTTHGRALTFATGVKLANPKLHVITIMGDGDCISIGGNHFLHACRRNVDITAIIINNQIYGMTGGQCSPTTPLDYNTTTTLAGNKTQALDIPEIAKASGASYVARGTVFHVPALDTMITKAVRHSGFSVLEIMSTCPTHLGRKNGRKNPVDALQWLGQNAIERGNSPEDDQFVIGVFKE